MSFILDALKKSETERQRQSGPALFEVKVAPPRTRIAPWAIGLVLLLALNVFVLAWVALRDGAPAADATPQRAAAVAAGVAEAPTSTTGASPSATALPSPVLSGTPPVANAAPLAPQAAAPAMTSAAPPGTSTDALPSRAPPLLEEPVLDEAEDLDNAPPPALASSPAPATAPDAVTPSNLPTREDLVARGTAVPELRLDMHVYGSRPDERFVFVNMRRLREGESTADGLRIERITPEGAVLSWQGKRFLLPKE